MSKAKDLKKIIVNWLKNDDYTKKEILISINNNKIGGKLLSKDCLVGNSIIIKQDRSKCTCICLEDVEYITLT